MTYLTFKQYLVTGEGEKNRKCNCIQCHFGTTKRYKYTAHCNVLQLAPPQERSYCSTLISHVKPCFHQLTTVFHKHKYKLHLCFNCLAFNGSFLIANHNTSTNCTNNFLLRLFQETRLSETHLPISALQEDYVLGRSSVLLWPPCKQLVWNQ